jgi:hypothetical protein
VVEYGELLVGDKYKAPQVSDEPSINALVSFVSCDENFGHLRKQAFDGELLKEAHEIVLFNVDDLVISTSVLLCHLGSQL